MSTPHQTHQSLSALALWSIAAIGGVCVGVVTAVAGDTLFLLGLWPLAAALAGGFGLVATAHLLRQRRLFAHLVATTLFALGWLASDRTANAWLFRVHQQQHVAQSGLLLADHAVLHDSDNPDVLIDAALMAETGAGGVIGAARVQLRHGVPVLRVLRSTRVIRTPLWGHVLWLALRAALVALIIARALEQLRADPVCATCGAWLRRQERGVVTAEEAAMLRTAWLQGERRPPEFNHPESTSATLVVEPISVLEDSCPNGHSVAPGYELRRPRGRGLARQAPGAIARLAPLTEPATETS